MFQGSQFGVKSDKNNALPMMISIVGLDQEERSAEELQVLAGYIKDIDFFKKRNLNEETMLEIVNCMNLLEMEKDEIVMEYGDIGQNFYLILQGEVEITVPDPNRKKAFLQLKKDIEAAIEVQN
jgi:hypothetical protein